MRPGTVSLRTPRVKLQVHKNPWRLYREIFLQGCYDPLVPLGPSPVIFDIGANIGLASLYFLERWPDARLAAWEPNPGAFAMLERNLAAAHFPRAEVRIEPTALSVEDGTVEFTAPTFDPTAVYASITREGSSTLGEWQKWEVKSVDAGRLFAEPADFLKLDIEGHEYPVLEHALPRASVTRSLAIEFHRVHRNLARLESAVGRLMDEGGYAAVDKEGRPVRVEGLHRHRGSLLLRFFDPTHSPPGAG
jgi:FkbM family methyltransferase